MRSLLPALCLLLVLPASAQDAPDIKHEVDLSIRWLRARQDRKTGAYGEGVEGTALVLRALATSPRHYVRRDGPYVADALDHLIGLQDEDGAIAEEGAGEEERLEQTKAAAEAMYLYVDEKTTRALGRAVAWLGSKGVSAPAGKPARATDDPTEARKRVNELLAKRGPDGSWKADLERTARNVIELNTYASLFQKDRTVPDGAQPLPQFTAADPEEVDEALRAGARFLLASAVEEGRWGAPGRPDAGMTAMVVGALQGVPEPRPEGVQAAIDSALDWLASLQNEDGSIHQGRLANYVTSSSVLALSRSSDPEHQAAVEHARDFLLGLQASGATGYSEDHPFYGGIGYGGDERPDLSNLQMALEALTAAGVSEDHESFQRAVKFLERCQNRTESNDLRVQAGDTVIVPGDDGGAAYYPGESKAGFVELEDGTLVPRSYGSMTYALLKGYVLAGLSKDDPRVKAAWEWLREHYTLDVNPGFEHSHDPTASYQGLYYYFLSMARALNTFGVDTIETTDGETHAWRRELAGRLISMQSKIDGSWVNENASRWWEGNPVLATAYAMSTLTETK